MQAVKRYRCVGRRGEKQMLLHRVRAERALGRRLDPRHPVHHVDGTKDENSPLVICEDYAYHHALHVRMRVRAAGGDPWNDKLCCRCHKAKPKREFHRRGDGLQTMCKKCQLQNASDYR